MLPAENRSGSAAAGSRPAGQGPGGAGDTVRDVAQMTPEQLQRRERAEAFIRLVAPALNLVLAAGDRVSRLVEPEDQEYYPPRPQTGAEPPPSVRRDAGARGE